MDGRTRLVAGGLIVTGDGAENLTGFPLGPEPNVLGA